jgi:hypothetical protein
MSFLLPAGGATITDISLQTITSASSLWTVGGAAVTFGPAADDVDITGGDDACYVTSPLNVDNTSPIIYNYDLDAGTVDNAGCCTGLFNFTEVGTVNHTSSNNGGLLSMTKSWGLRHSDGDVIYGSGSVGTLSGGGVSASDNVKWKIATDGTVTIDIEDSTEFTFSQKADGISITFIRAQSNGGRGTLNHFWSYFA